MNIKGIRGLYTANPLEAPEGSCSRAKNVWMRDKGVLEPRPGFGRHSTALSISSPSRIVFWRAQEELIVLGSSQAQKLDSSGGASGSPRTIPSAVPAQDQGLVISENYGSDLILGFQTAVSASSIGSIYSWEENNFLGYVRCLDARVHDISSDYAAGGYACGYRYVLGRNLSSGRVVLSAPSGVDRVFTQDATPAGNLTRRVYLHDSAVAGDFIQMYRTKLVFATDYNTPVGSSYYLCKEQALTGSPGNIANGYVDLADTTPDGALGPPLYTNPYDGEGELAANEMPPRLPEAGCVWDDRLWVMNGGVGFGDLQLQLLGTGTGANALADADTITIGGVAFTAKDTPTTTQHFQLFRSGSHTGSFTTASQWTHATAVALVNTVNNYFGASVMTCIDGDNTAGAMAVVSDTVTFSKQNAWAPVSGSDFTNTPPPGTFRVRFSKPGQPDSFRIDHFIDLGPEAIDGETCRGMVASENRISVFMSKSGVWEISGSFPYQVRHVNSGLRSLNQRCAIAHGDSVYTLTVDGRMLSLVGKSGFVRSVGDDISPDLMISANSESSSGNFRGLLMSSSGVDRRLSIWCLGIGKISGAYVLNSEHGAWMTWEADPGLGVLDVCEMHFEYGNYGGEALLMEESSTGSFFVYRTKNANIIDDTFMSQGQDGDSYRLRTDKSDDNDDDVSVSTTNQSASATLIISDTSSDKVNTGDSFILSDKDYGLVTSVNGNTAVMSREAQETAGLSLLAYKPFPVSIRMSGTDGGESRIRFRDVAAKFGDVRSKGTLKIYAHSDLSTDEEGQAYETFGHGRGAWGSSVWGDKRPSVITVRRYVPQNSSDASVLYVGLEMNEAFGYFRLLGWSITGDKVSERTGR